MIAVLGLVGSTVPAQAASTDLVTAQETQAALRGTQDEFVLTASDGAGLGRSRLSASVMVDIPQNPKRGIAVEIDGSSMTILLPGAKDSGRGVQLSDGVVAFPGRRFSNAVIASSEGVQLLTTLSSAASPTRFEYPLDVPQGATLEEIGGGNVAVVDTNGLPLVVVQSPWARDANGSKIETRYSIEGHTLVQHVYHRVPGVAYPVVADPKFEWWGGLPTVKLNRNDTYKMRYAATPAKLSLCVALGGPAGVALAVPCALSISVLSAKAGSVYAKGKCLRVIIGPGVLGGAEYKDSYCK